MHVSGGEGGLGESEPELEGRNPEEQGSMYLSRGGTWSGQVKGSVSVDSRVDWTEWRIRATIGFLATMACM